MNILFIQLRTNDGGGSIPFGVLYAGSAVSRCGHNVKILDLSKNQFTYKELSDVINNYKPGIIGFGGITSCYANCKRLAGYIKKNHREVPIIVGGVISSVYDLLIEKAGVDYVVHGEGETVLPELIEAIKRQSDISNVKGVSFLKDGAVFRTEDREQVADLDTIPIPEYRLLDMEKYISPIDEWLYAYFRYDIQEFAAMKKLLKSSRTLLPIITSRGCTHKCIFCYRHYRGVRQHSPAYVVNMMKTIRNNFGVGVFQISDELTTVNKKWVLEMCRILIKERLGIFFIVLSSRVDSVDREMLEMLKAAGCIMINYGYETGSDVILREIRKGVTMEKALDTALLTRKIGIKNVPEIIFGFPSESADTIRETVDFLKKLDTWPISVNTPIPFPETPLWDYAIANNLIRDKEKFVLTYKNGLFMNFTRYSEEKLRFMIRMAYFSVEFNWLKNRKKYIACVKCVLKTFVVIATGIILRSKVFKGMRDIYPQRFCFQDANEI